jgi:hypothetical protein
VKYTRSVSFLGVCFLLLKSRQEPALEKVEMDESFAVNHKKQTPKNETLRVYTHN